MGRVLDKQPSATFTAFLTFAVISTAAVAADLSTYRDIQLGAGLEAVSQQLGVTPADAIVIHSRPALIQELAWRPQHLGPSSDTEAVRKVAFRFYAGELFRIVVEYDHLETEGLTARDFVQAFSETYGVPAPLAGAAPGLYEGQEQLLARWEDSEYRFDLVRLAYGPAVSLVGTLKRLEAPAEAALIEAERLDYKEAPQREAERRARDEKVRAAKGQKARLVNKPNFRP